MKLIFAGTPEFAREALAALHAAGHDIALVLTQPDRPAGRGMKLQASPVKQFALAHGIPVGQPHSLRLDGKYPDEAAAAKAQIDAVQADAMVVAAYGLILPPWTLDAPRLGCLNIHASLLPRWRGAAPIHRAIEAGDAQTGTTIMQMDAGLDTGDMLLVEAEAIGPTDTTAALHDRLAAQGGRLIVQAMARLQAGEPLVRTPQPVEGITYAHKIEKAEAAIDWALPASLIERRVRAFDPFPGCTAALQTDKGPELLKVWAASVVHASGTPGEVLHAQGDTLVVACGEQALALQTVQRAGGKRIGARDFLQVCPAPRLA
jgi:methionyl-tRNA formyltransferase